MSTKCRLLTLSVFASVFLAGTAVHAGPVSIGYSIGGAAITTFGSSATGATSGTVVDSGYTISVSATGSPAVPEPNFSSNTVTVKSAGAGTVRLFASETGLTAQVPSFEIGWSNNPLSDTSVLESFYTSSTNTAYALTNLVAQNVVSPGVTTVQTTSTGSPSGPYSITELYTITFGTGGGTVNATIIERAVVPEPVSLSLLGAGLVGIGLVRRNKRAV